MNIDLFPTLLSLAGISIPADRIVDGKNISQLLVGKSSQPVHDYLYFYHHGKLEAARTGKWKVYRSANHYVWPLPLNNNDRGKLSNYTTGPMPMMFDIEKDKGEAYNLFEKYPDVGNQLLRQMEAWDQHMENNRGGLL
jgi:arylsulfatase